MTPVERWREEPARALPRALRAGAAVDPRSLDGWAFRGTVLATPGLVERATWTTFQKAFRRDPSTGRLLGWNVRLEQDGVGRPSRPRLRGGVPWCRWFFEVLPSRGLGGVDSVLIDYARGPNPRWEPVRWVKDPLVDVGDGLLLGVSWVVLAGRALSTPTWFVLEREHEIRHVPPEVACG